MILRRLTAASMAGLVLLAACSADGDDAAPNPAGADPASPFPDESSELVPNIVAGIDLSRSTVPLDEIIFDTFGAGPLALDEASEAQILALLDAIAPIDDPRYDTNADWLRGDDLVIGHVDATGQARAWPHRILNFHEIVNDELDGDPVLVSYCPLCRSGVIYDRRVDTGDGPMTLSFGNSSALYENDLVMVDRQTNSYWWQVRGMAIVGTLSGAELTPIASRTTTWERWSADHPDTLVLQRPGGRSYDSDPFAGYADRVSAEQFPFPVSDESLSRTELTADVLVTMVMVDSGAVAVPQDGDAASVVFAGQSTVAGAEGTDVFVIVDGEGGAVAVRSKESLDLVDEAVVDAGGRRFDLDGRSLDGGTALDLEPSRSSFWFAIVASFPDIVVAN